LIRRVLKRESHNDGKSLQRSEPVWEQEKLDNSGTVHQMWEGEIGRGNWVSPPLKNIRSPRTTYEKKKGMGEEGRGRSLRGPHFGPLWGDRPGRRKVLP